MAKQVTIELEEGIYKMLVFVSETINEPIEKLIVDGLYNHTIGIEEKILSAFGGEDAL